MPEAARRLHAFYTLDADPICGWLKSFDLAADLTHQDLLKLPSLDRHDLVYFNSAQPAQLLAIVRWLSDLSPDRTPQVVVEFGTEPGLDITVTPNGFVGQPRDPRQDGRAAFYRFVGTKISPHVLSHLHMMTFEQQTSAIFAALIQHPVGVLPFPHHAVTPLRRRPREGAMTVAVLGHQRPDKGYFHVPKIARRILHERGHVRMLVHNGGPEFMRDTQQAMRSLAALEPRIKIDERTAGPQTWAELLDASDLLLLPYDPSRFRAAYSAIAAEAVANAIPLVGPAGTSIERLIADAGQCGTVFGEFEPDSIAAAVISLIDDFGRYATAAHAAAEQWPRHYGPDRLVDAILACAAPPT
jgi:glycosyltransferase involved in cell wall biosynthesis